MASRTAILVGILGIVILSACSDGDESRPGSTATPVAPPAVIVVDLTPEGEDITGESCGPSMAVSRPNAWRCFADSEIYDPCFGEADRGAEVICGTSEPWDALGVRVILDEPLSAPQMGEDASKVWGIELADGTRCSWLGGATATVEGARVNYGCSDEWVIVGSLRVEPPWIARLVQLPSASAPPVQSRDVPITTVWR